MLTLFCLGNPTLKHKYNRHRLLHRIDERDRSSICRRLLEQVLPPLGNGVGWPARNARRPADQLLPERRLFLPHFLQGVLLPQGGIALRRSSGRSAPLFGGCSLLHCHRLRRSIHLSRAILLARRTGYRLLHEPLIRLSWKNPYKN
jgi:hypothetical protein